MDHHPHPAWLLTVFAVIGAALAIWIVVFFLRNMWVILNGLVQP